MVLEINSSPGLEGIEMASGINVASKVIEFLEKDAHFASVSVDQLMRSVRGHGVLPLHLSHHPWLVGKKIMELFPSTTSPAFALSRNKEMVWAPEPSMKLRYDDILICYGDLLELRGSLKGFTEPIIGQTSFSTDSADGYFV